MRQKFAGNADAGVAHPKHRLVALLFNTEPDLPAFIGVLGRVGEQIDQNLLQAGGISIQPEGLWRQYDQEFMATLSDEGVERLNGALDDVAHLRRFLSQLNNARVDAGYFQQFVDKMRQLSDLTINDIRGLLQHGFVIFLQSQKIYGI